MLDLVAELKRKALGTPAPVETTTEQKTRKELWMVPNG
jgi:hypothetical protein